MGKNRGGKPADTILTLEEALMRFKGQRGEAGAEMRVDGGSESNVHHVDFSAAAKREGEGKATGYLEAEDIASVSDQHDEANAEMSASDIVAVIDGIPRTLDDLEKTLSGVFDVRTSATSEPARAGEGERRAGAVTKVVGVDRPNAIIIVGTEASYLRQRYGDDLQAAFAEALTDLTPRQRNILRMHFLDGVPLDRRECFVGDPLRHQFGHRPQEGVPGLDMGIQEAQGFARLERLHRSVLENDLFSATFFFFFGYQIGK